MFPEVNATHDSMMQIRAGLRLAGELDRVRNREGLISSKGFKT